MLLLPNTAQRRSSAARTEGKHVRAGGRQECPLRFHLLILLFALWGFCNGMIDVMDKHFQEELHLSQSQSAWVQFAHYLGYFLMSLPAGWLATKLGYKGGIIAGLLMVAVGGFWFIPATHIACTFWALSFLRRLHHRRRPDFSRNHRQSLHHRAGAIRNTRPRASISRNPATASAGSSARSRAACFSTPRMPRAKAPAARRSTFPMPASPCVVIVLAVVFYFANVPDIKMEDDYHLDDADCPDVSHSIWSHPHSVMAVPRSSSMSPRRPASSASSSTT